MSISRPANLVRRGVKVLKSNKGHQKHSCELIYVYKTKKKKKWVDLLSLTEGLQNLSV